MVEENNKFNPQIIALYLPQFHPFKENNEWWGPGFTEWTNVGKAKPLFRGHNQPRVPRELNYYDLRVPEVRQQQVDLAKEAGVTAFCYWHYWFGNGKVLMEDVFDDVLASGKPDFAFCLGWANHSWYAKTWSKDAPDKLLIEQTYPGIEDARMHFEYLLKAFKDDRYLKIDGKPFLYIYDFQHLPKEYIQNFKKWTKEAGFPDLYITGNVFRTYEKKEDYLNEGANAVVYDRANYFKSENSLLHGRWYYGLYRRWRELLSVLLHRPVFLYDFRKIYHYLVTDGEKEIDQIPVILSGYDHSPRSGRKGLIYNHCTPKYFEKHCKEVLEAVKDKPEPYQIVMLRSWNEWAEGNYMEPDLTYGKGFINALHNAIEDVKKESENK